MLTWIRTHYPRPSLHSRIPTFPRTAWYDAAFYNNLALPGAAPFTFFTTDLSIANTFKDQPPQRQYLTANAHHLATSADGTGYFRFRDIRNITTTGPSDFQYDKAHFFPLFMQMPTLRPTQLDEALTDLCEQILFLHRRFDLLLTKDPLTRDPIPLIVDLTALITNTVSDPVSSSQPASDRPNENSPASVKADSTSVYPDLSTPYIIPPARSRNIAVQGSTEVDPQMPAPKRHRGLGMRYSSPLPSYLPLAGRHDSMTRSINYRCQTYAVPGSIPPSKLYTNPVASHVSSPTPPPSQVPHEHTLLPVNHMHPAARMKQRRVNRPVTTWPARPGAADYFDSAQFTVAQTPHSPLKGPMPPRMSPSLETGTDHSLNSENTFANIAPVSAAVDALILPQAPLINIPAHLPNDANPRLRAVWQHNHRYHPISPIPRSTPVRPSEHLDAQPMPEETTDGAASPSAKPHNSTISRSQGGHQKASKQKRRQRRSRATLIPTVCHPTPSAHTTPRHNIAGDMEKM